MAQITASERRPGSTSARDSKTSGRSPQGSALTAWQHRADQSEPVRQLAKWSGHRVTQRRPAADRDEGPQDGLPADLRHGIETLSGMDMGAVRVHRNSAAPQQVGAHAFAQGADIHLGPGQGEHLPHEAWHSVQQAQGRVHPTRQLKEATVAINDDPGLEREADQMGARAMSLARQRMAVPEDG